MVKKGQIITYTGIKRFGGTGPQTVFRDNETLPLEPSQGLLNHSPSGFNWGYGGEGPKQLALALLLDVTGEPETALQHYQAFNKNFVSFWPEVWSITDKDIRDWLSVRSKQGQTSSTN